MDSRTEDQSRLKVVEDEIGQIDRAEEHGVLMLYGIKYRAALKAEAAELRARLQTH